MAGTAATAGVVVVVLVVVVGVVQPVNEIRAATTTHERMNIFINVLVVWFIVLHLNNDIIGWVLLSGITLSIRKRIDK